MEIKQFEVTSFAVNCYLLSDGGDAIVIDPGDATEELLDALSGLNVKTIVNTHGHCDHCGGNAKLVEKTGAELLIHEEDRAMLQSLEYQGEMFGVPFSASPEPTRFVNEGDKISFGNIELEVLHVPGHSLGHIALLGEGCVFSGDVLFAGSIGRTDLPGGNYDQLIQTIREKLLVLPDETIVYAGHGTATTIGDEKLKNPFLM